MTPLVVDASAIINILVSPGDDGERSAARIRGAELHAPDHLSVEVSNVLRRRRNRRELSEAEARIAFDEFWGLTVHLWPFQTVADRAWSLGENATSYDGAYLALAEQLGAPLLTADAKLSAVPGIRCAVEVLE